MRIGLELRSGVGVGRDVYGVEMEMGYLELKERGFLGFVLFCFRRNGFRWIMANCTSDMEVSG